MSHTTPEVPIRTRESQPEQEPRKSNPKTGVGYLHSRRNSKTGLAAPTLTLSAFLCSVPH
eukprot:3124510-Rhodomonas_salina.1